MAARGAPTLPVGPSGNRAQSLMAEELKVPLADIPGVQEVEIEGEYQREFHVLLDPGRMAALGVSFDQAARALEAANVSLPAGDYTNESGEFMIRVDERFRTRDQVAATVVRRDKDGSAVTVADLMTTRAWATRTPRVISSVNGQDAVTLKIKKTEAGNALDIMAGVQAVRPTSPPPWTRGSGRRAHRGLHTTSPNAIHPGLEHGPGHRPGLRHHLVHHGRAQRA
jgi:HAE1 family hydrophobic/amphiphilic exporter-1